ncbi:GTP cyclohydrolase II [Ceratobasidium sp. 428]|nr:GTP cyclohydrolase II [Ceratobasidium sp. 428]
MATVTQPQHFDITPSDLELLEQLTSSADLSSIPRHGRAFSRREAPLDPLLFAAAAASGPHVTRHHYHHDFFPVDEESENPLVGSYARCDTNDDAEPRYVSRQKPRRERLRELGVTEDGRAAVGPPEGDNKLAESPVPVPASELRSPVKSRHRRPSLLPSADPTPAIELLQLSNPPMSAAQPLLSKSSSHDPVAVQCRARTRIPTPHGPAFLHIYHNNRDSKEHLAVVIDSAQLDQTDHPTPLPPIRSTSLDAVWREGETETERIVRGAYVGRLSSTTANPSSPTSTHREYPADAPAPLVRIHSECFTGETIGSMRCDCGEQLDEAMRLIAQPVRIPSTGEVVPGRGAVVYMRQEGRGIGLLEKIRAYNLQDLGHDTVTANLMLGHGADERGYEIAAAIMRDLGLETEGRGVRLLTNNPEKMEALERESIRIEQRVGMVPRSWKAHANTTRGRGRARTITNKDRDAEDSDDSYDEHLLRRGGATLIGGGAAHGVELERYLATKVQRMGHMLDLPSHGHSGDSGLGLVSQAVSDDEDGMSKSVGSLLDSPGLEFDSASYHSRSVSPVEL